MCTDSNSFRQKRHDSSSVHRKETIKLRLTKEDSIKTHTTPAFKNPPISKVLLSLFRIGGTRCSSLCSTPYSIQTVGVARAKSENDVTANDFYERLNSSDVSLMETLFVERAHIIIFILYNLNIAFLDYRTWGKVKWA